MHKNVASRSLRKLTDALCDHPWLVLLPQLLLFGACAAYSWTHLEFSANRADLISPQVKYQRDFAEFKREFRMPERLVAIVESHSQANNRRFVEQLAGKLALEPELFSDTYYKGDLTQMGSKALLLLPESNLRALRRDLENNRPLIESFSEPNSLASLFDRVNQQFRELESADSIEETDLSRTLVALLRLIDETTQATGEHAASPAPGVAWLFRDETGPYLSFAGGEIYAVFTHAADQKTEAKSIERLRQLVYETQGEVPGVNAGISGEPVLNHDEMSQARRDVSLAALLSVLLVAVIFIYGYHEVARPLLATFCLLIGIGYTLGFATLAVGRLNLLSITLVPILIGLAIDFGVHLITRYEEELRAEKTRREALRQALALTGVGIFTSGFTTAGAFFAMMLTDFKGVTEMGFLAGAGLLICLVPMLTLLPVFLAAGKPDAPGKRDDRIESGRAAWIEQFWSNRPKLVLWSGAGLTLLSITQFPQLEFDYNLLNLQSRGLPAVDIEEKLVRSGSVSLLHGIVIADSLNQAAELEARIERLPEVARIDSVVEYLTENQDEKLELVRAIRSLANNIRLPPPATNSVDLARLSQELFALQGYLGVAIEKASHQDLDRDLQENLSRLHGSVDQLRSAISRAPDAAVPRLTEFQTELFDDYRKTVSALRKQDASERLQAKDLPPLLRENFISPSGAFLLRVYSKEDVWQREHQRQFVEALRRIDPDVTGTLVQIHEYTSMLKTGFEHAGAYAAGIVSFLVLLHFRRLSAVLLAFFPVLLGGCWTLGLMGLLGIQFNPVNIMGLTLVIGIGITNGIHILNRFAEEQHPGILAKSTGKAVLVSAFTTMVGFGSLMTAKHQGIASLGIVMTLGTAMCMLAALTVLPAILNVTRRPSITVPSDDR